jgi:hypothetical protein
MTDVTAPQARHDDATGEGSDAGQRRTADVTERASAHREAASHGVLSEPVMQPGERIIHAALTLLLVAAVLAFAWHWVTLPGALAHPVSYSLLTVAGGGFLATWLGRWVSLAAMRRPRHVPPEPGLRVGVVTTFVPGAEPIGMLEQTVRALVAMEYPHETWVLDEGDDAAVRALCERLGARHFTRRGRERYQTESGEFQAQSKHGNYNAWLEEVAYDRYDVVAAFDTDHVPERGYLLRTLGYFRDPAVGYVQAPQVYYNQKTGFVARGAAEETYAFYSIQQMANFGLGHPTVIGSHNVHRVRALREVGGFAPHDADDLLITLRYEAARWRGVYVPEVLALGLTPVDWHGYFRQQVRWARSVIDIKLRVLPRLASRLSPVDRMLAWAHGAFYLRPLVVPMLYALAAYIMLIGDEPPMLRPPTLVRLAALLAVLALAWRFAQRFYLDPRREAGLHWRVLLLQLAKWPFFAVAASRALAGRPVPYELTMKVRVIGRREVLMWPHRVVGILMLEAWVLGWLLNGHVAPALTAVAAIVVGVSAVLTWSELREVPPPWDARRYARRRAELSDLLGPPPDDIAAAARPAGAASEGRR